MVSDRKIMRRDTSLQDSLLLAAIGFSICWDVARAPFVIADVEHATILQFFLRSHPWMANEFLLGSPSHLFVGGTGPPINIFIWNLF